MSPTGGIFVKLSAPRLTVVAATVTQGKYLLRIISAQEPYLFPERHRHLKVSKKCPRTGASFVMVHHSLSPIKADTLSKGRLFLFFSKVFTQFHRLHLDCIIYVNYSKIGQGMVG
jgi:hypothetical protein